MTSRLIDHMLRRRTGISHQYRAIKRVKQARTHKDQLVLVSDLQDTKF